MQRPIKPQWLLRQADELAGRHRGPGQPRSADLRRAVSAAYYALFHEVALGVVSALAPGADQLDRWRLTRHVQHNAVRSVCDWVASTKAPPSRVRDAMVPLRQTHGLHQAAVTFRILQDSRYCGDYDHTAEFAKEEVLALIDAGRDAITNLGEVAGTPDHLVFATHVLLKSTLR